MTLVERFAPDVAEAELSLGLRDPHDAHQAVRPGERVAGAEALVEPPHDGAAVAPVAVGVVDEVARPLELELHPRLVASHGGGRYR